MKKVCEYEQWREKENIQEELFRLSVLDTVSKKYIVKKTNLSFDDAYDFQNELEWLGFKCVIAPHVRAERKVEHFNWNIRY